MAGGVEQRRERAEFKRTPGPRLCIQIRIVGIDDAQRQRRLRHGRGEQDIVLLEESADAPAHLVGGCLCPEQGFRLDLLAIPVTGEDGCLQVILINRPTGEHCRIIDEHGQVGRPQDHGCLEEMLPVEWRPGFGNLVSQFFTELRGLRYRVPDLSVNFHTRPGLVHPGYFQRTGVFQHAACIGFAGYRDLERIANAGSFDGIQQGCRIPDRPGHGKFHRQPAQWFGAVRTVRHPAPTRFQADQAAAGGRDTNGTAAVIGMGKRNDACSNRRSRGAAGTARHS